MTVGVVIYCVLFIAFLKFMMSLPVEETTVNNKLERYVFWAVNREYVAVALSEQSAREMISAIHSVSISSLVLRYKEKIK